MKARSEEWRCMHLKMVNVKTNNKTHSQKKKKTKQNQTQEGSAWQQASIYVSGWHAQQRKSLQKREEVYKYF